MKISQEIKTILVQTQSYDQIIFLESLCYIEKQGLKIIFTYNHFSNDIIFEDEKVCEGYFDEIIRKIKL